MKAMYESDVEMLASPPRQQMGASPGEGRHRARVRPLPVCRPVAQCAGERHALLVAARGALRGAPDTPHAGTPPWEPNGTSHSPAAGPPSARRGPRGAGTGRKISATFQAGFRYMSGTVAGAIVDC